MAGSLSGYMTAEGEEGGTLVDSFPRKQIRCVLDQFSSMEVALLPTGPLHASS